MFREKIETATTVAELKQLAKQLQLRKVPAGISLEMLRQVLLSTVGDREVYVVPICGCSHTKKQHQMDNATGEAFECKLPTCDCKKFHVKA